jgi:hypothetical protein
MRNSQRVMAGLFGAILALLVVTAIWIKVAAPQRPQLSGERTTGTYDYADFAAVSVSGQWQVTIERGDVWRVAVDVPAEVIDDVRVERSGEGLAVGYDGAWWFGGFGRGDGDVLKATITMPALESIELSGTSTLSLSGFEGDRLSLTSSGASEVRGASGRFETLALVMSGAGNVDLDGLLVTNADIQVSGAGNLKLNMAGGRLTGNMSGAGNLEYRGAVSEQSVSSSGLVNIRRRN